MPANDDQFDNDDDSSNIDIEMLTDGFETEPAEVEGSESSCPKNVEIQVC